MPLARKKKEPGQGSIVRAEEKKGRGRLFFGREGNGRRFSKNTLAMGAESGLIAPYRADELRREFFDRFLHGGILHLDNLVQDAVGQLLSGIGQKDVHFAPFAGDRTQGDEPFLLPVLDDRVHRGAWDVPFVADLLLGIRYAVREGIEDHQLIFLEIGGLSAYGITAVDAVQCCHELGDLFADKFHGR